MMGTKLDPGKFDCYAKAEPNEPIFVLRAKDPIAAYIVEVWGDIAGLMKIHGEDKILEAFKCAEQIRQWRKDKGLDQE